MDGTTAGKLFAAIATFATDHDSFISKTKLLKLLYLFDVEYFRVHRTTFTGFRWKFFHLGPWAAEFDPTLDAILASAVLEQHFHKYDTPLYRSTQPVEPGAPFSNVKDEMILRGVLKTWGAAQTSDILDRVYFGTEPMESAMRNEPLDFSVIPSQAAPIYKRSSSGIPPTEIARIRAKFEADRAKIIKASTTAEITPPRYDEAFEKAMAIMDSDE